jgi:hypothetical protein
VTGTVQTTQGAVTFGNGATDTSVAVNVGDVAPSTEVTITFQVQIDDPLPPGVVDAQNQGLVRFTDGVPQLMGTDDPTTPASGDATVVSILRDPALIAQKTLAGADNDAVAPNFVTFTISIYNTGLAADVLSMTDDYDDFFLSFVDAIPYPDEDADDGSLHWYDLTAPPPYGTGSDLVPGETMTVTVVFSVANDIILTVNTARVHTATDPYGAPVIGSTSSASVNNIVTAAELAYFRVDEVNRRSVHLSWATVTEIDNVGFRLYRKYNSAHSPSEMVAFVPAQGNGTGATYAHVDTVPGDGLWWYWLTDVDTSGVETFQGTVQATAKKGPDQVFIPFVLTPFGQGPGD